MADPRVNYRIGAIDETKKALDGVASNFRGLGKILAGLGAGLSVAGITAYVTNLFQETDKLGKLTSRIKADVVEFQRLAELAARENIGTDQLGNGLEEQSRKIAEAAKGLGEAKTALESLNIDPTSLLGVDPVAQFQAIAQAMLLTQDQGERLFAAQKLWGDAGTTFLNLIQAQAFELTNLQSATYDMRFLTEEQVKAIEALNTRLGESKRLVKSYIDSLVADLAPQFNKLLDFIDEKVKFLIDNVQFIGDVFRNTFGGLLSLLQDFYGWVNDLIPLIGQLAAAIGSISLFGGGATTVPQGAYIPPNSSGLINRQYGTIFPGAPSGILE